MIARPLSLGEMLRRTVARPRSAAALLACHASELEFRLIVGAIFPNEEADIWQARQGGTSRETARVEGFLRRVEEHFFPVYEADEYEQVAWAIPFVRLAWSYEDFHDLERRAGEELLLALCEAPVDMRVPLLDWAEAHVPSDVLARIPPTGFNRDDLHAQFDGTSCAAVADFADWLWGETGTVFLDLDDEIEVTDAGWSQENVLDLADQWREAQGILDRIESLVTWLEADTAARFTQLVDAALGDNTHLIYERSRRLYELEITERGLVPVEHDEPASALSMGAAA